MLNCMQRVTVTSVRFRLSTNSNLACQEKLAHGPCTPQIHQVSNSSVGKSTYQWSHSRFSLRLSALESDSKAKHCSFFPESKSFGSHSIARELQSATDHRSKVEFRSAAQGSRHTSQLSEPKALHSKTGLHSALNTAKALRDL